MTAQTLHLGSQPMPARSEAFSLVCFGLLAANLALLAVSWHGWIIDRDGQIAPADFLNVYAAGRLVLDGHPAAAYDWDLLHAAANAVIGRDWAAYFGWHYPPPFLMVAALLATLPYAAAFVSWLAATLPLYLVTIRAIVRDRSGWLIAGAFPCLLPNLIPGQNGFLTASLIGGALALLERHPCLAGACLGLLTYKPQFGVLFPVVLIAGGHWRAIGAAAATAAMLVLASIVLFGVTPWSEFVHWLPRTSQALFAQDAHHADWNKFQSLLALVRMLGGGATLAWALQLALTALTAIALWLLWREDRVAYELKAAATAVGVLIATPYVYLYDLTVLAVAVGFLVRLAGVTAFGRGETIGLTAVALLLLVVPLLGWPVGLSTAAITAWLIARRVFWRASA